MPDIAHLLQDLEPLPHGERMRRVVEWGQRARIEPAIASLLSCWAEGSFYERQLALKSCFGTGDSAIAEAALTDPSRALRAMAVETVAKVGDDAALARTWPKLSARKRAELVRHLHRARRQAPIDVYLERGVREGDPAVAALLPFGSPEVVGQHLEAVNAHMSLGDWARAASFHPELVHRALMRQAEAATVQDARLNARFNATVSSLAAAMPDATIALVQAIRRTTSLAKLDLAPLAEAAPEQTARLILGAADQATASFYKVMIRLEEPTLVALFERLRFSWMVGQSRRPKPKSRWKKPGHLNGPGGAPHRVASRLGWMSALPPEVRERLFDLTRKFWPTTYMEIAPEGLRLLPFQRRRQEALRIWEVPALQLEPVQRAAYAAFFDWPTALERLGAYLDDPEAAIRAAALTALLGIVNSDPARLGEALAIVQAGRNEQDPVRLAMLTGLANLKRSVWHAEHLGRLDAILEDAMDVGDRSYQSQLQVMTIVAKLLPSHPEWAVAWLDRFVRQYERLLLLDYETRLADAEMPRLGAALMPILLGWKELGGRPEGSILGMLHALGYRAAAMPGLLDLLEAMIQDPDNQHSVAALTFLADLDHPRFSWLVPTLLAADDSWAQQDVVNGFLHRERQDLLTPLLNRTSFEGRFPTEPADTPFVLPFKTDFQTWTATQLDLFSRFLEQVEVQDDPRDVRTARRRRTAQVPRTAQVLVQLSAMPITRTERLRRSAGLDVKDQLIRDTALRGLGRLDDGSGVPELLEALQDERDRVAIYALRKPLLEMPPAQAAALIRDFPVKRLTIAKEVARLWGLLNTPDAYDELVALAGQVRHRDARIAVMRALWDHLDEGPTWTVLEDAAASPDVAVALMATRTPFHGLAERRLANGLALFDALLRHPEPRVRVALLQRLAKEAFPDPARVLMPRIREAIARADTEASEATNLLFAVYTGSGPEPLGPLLAWLADRRWQQADLVRRLGEAVKTHRGQLLPSVRAAISALEQAPLTAHWRAELACRGLPWDELGDELTRMAERDELHPDAYLAANQALQDGGVRRASETTLEAFEARMRASPHAVLRRLGYTALLIGWGTQVRAQSDWEAVRAQYRADASPWVASAAAMY